MQKQDCEQLTFYLGDSPASRFPLPGSEAAQRMTATSGRRCCELLPNSDPLSSLARMLLVSSRWRSRLVTLQWKAETLPLMRTVTRERSILKRNDMSSPEYSKTLNISVTKSSYLYFRLVPQTPRTAETGYVLLPTPTASDGLQGGVIGADDTFHTTESGTLRKVNRSGADGSVGLGRLVQMWSTPTACEWKGRGPNSKQQGLAEEVQLWVGTPTANMSTTGRSEKFREGRTPNPVEFAQMFPTPRANESGDYCYSRGDHSKPTPTLSGAVKMFPTPTANEYKGARTPEGLARAGRTPENSLADTIAMYPTPTTGAPLCGGSGNYAQLKRLVDSDAITKHEKQQMSQPGRVRLNPDWVEWLMGVPQGWTDIEVDIPLPEHNPHWYDVEPPIPRVATGVKSRVDRLKSLGNMVDPYQFFPVMECIAGILKGGRT